DDGHVGARIADLEVGVDGCDLALATLLYMHVHTGASAADLARHLGGVIGAATRHDDDLDDPRHVRLLLEQRLEQAADVGGLVVGGDADRDVHEGGGEGGRTRWRTAPTMPERYQNSR